MDGCKKILVVEDSAVNRMILSGILSEKYQVLEAENGKEAIDLLKQYGEQVSLILLDIVMPVMDGYAFLSAVKADSSLSSIPVIVTTQSDRESDEVAALSKGAADFVAKPYRPQIILHRVASIINLRETAAMINLIQYDRLTGLYSKEYFYQQAKTILIQNPDKEYDIICSDIENFKLINDVFGIPAGDRLLMNVADLCREFVGEKGIYGRLNADQFACLIERPASYTDDAFREASIRLTAVSPTKNVAMKWGIYPVDNRFLPVEQMCDWALLAVQRIKGQYGKYLAIYDEELRGKLLREQAVTDAMEIALAQGQFEIYLQPKYQLSCDSLAGAEALVRWNHPEWGLQSPGEFIPIFERNGFITKLDEFVWDKACAILKEWDAKGYPPLAVSVNVSRADIYNADLADILTKTVQKYDLQPARLHLEITESAYTENPEQIIKTVRHLRDLGFIIEMDDFGSGYSSLNMLNQMTLDILKLDMKFIQNETAKPMNQGVLRFIMQLARSMNLSVVAEGVETKSQLERLREIGCDYVQGYYFAKPMRCGDFEELWKSHDTMAGAETANQPPFLTRDWRRVILVADEDPAYRSAVRNTFSNEFQVEEAADGGGVLETIQKFDKKIDAVVLSLTLSDGEGLGALKGLQRERGAWNVPVIATGPADARLEREAFRIGADEYADKPHFQESLYKKVQHAMELAKARLREQTLKTEAHRDYMTGLLNRRGLEAALRELRREDAPLAVYLFDLDNLKRTNDTYGHVQGDELIREFGRLLHTHTRAESDLLVRYGGDEFVAVMKRMKSEETALQKGEEICRAIQEFTLAKDMRASCSAGIVLWNGEETFDGVIQKADKALYEVKSKQKGGCRIWKA
ncbi:EAL domain-containing protein [Lacrimispora sp. NSJ-141]|uniref:Stage 0 sporulation protein A homolog n=1 Tax=Lientehia hominis TaxID=2897778 RepID=A0AAP2W985_9FIRM|nr:EAL domain-containing protein [Lientehia hominis]MCD2491592.1 EAL domain-containing protein [Lientehia hominis]